MDGGISPAAYCIRQLAPRVFLNTGTVTASDWIRSQFGWHFPTWFLLVFQLKFIRLGNPNRASNSLNFSQFSSKWPKILAMYCQLNPLSLYKMNKKYLTVVSRLHSCFSIFFSFSFRFLLKCVMIAISLGTCRAYQTIIYFFQEE